MTLRPKQRRDREKEPMQLDLLEVGVGLLRVERLVAGHDGHEVLGVGEVGDGVCPAGDHVHGLDLVARDLELHDLARREVALADEPVAGHHDELLPLAGVPVVALGDARLGDVHGDLPAAVRVHKLREGAAGVAVHLEGILEPLLGQVREVQREELLGKGALGHLGHQERLGLGLEPLEQGDDLPESHPVDDGHMAVAPLGVGDGLDALETASLLLALEEVEHALHQVVDVEELELDGGVAHRVGLVVGDRPAEGGDGRVVVGAGVAHEVGEAVDGHLGARLLAVAEEQLLARELGAAVLRVAEAAGERRLHRGGEHDGARVARRPEGVEQPRGEAEVARHEVGRVLGAVDAREVEHEARPGAPLGELLGGGLHVVLEDLAHLQARSRAVLALADVPQRAAQGRAHHALGSGDQDVHYCTASCSRP